MVCTSSLGSALLMAASGLTLSNAHLEYTIRVRNLTYMQPFSPIFLMAHTKDLSSPRVGLPASDFLKQVAETGTIPDIDALILEGGVTQFVCGLLVGSAGVMPGETQRLTLTVDDDICEGGGLISMLSMLGTEDNNELCTHIPGPACSGTAGNEEAGPGEGYVHVHRGVHGVSGELPADTFTWLNPVAEVYISKPTEA